MLRHSFASDKGRHQTQQIGGASPYAGSLQASLNECLLRNMALVMADLEQKVTTRVQLQKQGKLKESKVRIAHILPRILFRQRLRAFRRLKDLLGIDK